MKKINIAIDGPSGVGKSTIAKIIANQLDLIFVNTGLMYRCIGYICLKNKIKFDDEKSILDYLNKIKIELLPNEIIKLNNEDITKNLWTDEVSLAASRVAKLKLIREFCVHHQQEIAKNQPGIVMEGRDIGSVVLKDADLKFFLTASVETRAARRIKQLSLKGQKVNEEEILNNIIERDKRDSEREHTPLIKPENAIEIDTSFLTIEEVVDKMIELAKEKMK